MLYGTNVVHMVHIVHFVHYNKLKKLIKQQQMHHSIAYIAFFLQLGDGGSTVVKVLCYKS